MDKSIHQSSNTTRLIKKLRAWGSRPDAAQTIYLVFGFCVIVLLMVLLQFSTSAICCGDWDGYYHIRWSALIWENLRNFQALPDFKWLPLTVLNSAEYADHHFLFHLFQIPFLWFFKPVMAAKVAAVFYGSLAVFSVYWLIFCHKIDYLLIWLFALLTSSDAFLYRMNMAKAPPLTIIFSIAGIYLLFQRRYVWLLPLMFLFVWTYSLFPLLLVAAVIWAGVIAWNERRLEWRPIVYTTGGMILGNIINPYFPKNIFLFLEHFSTKFRVEYEVAVGGEWYPYSGKEMLSHLGIALIAMVIGYCLFRPLERNRLPEKATFFLVFSTILLAAMFLSKRLAEYFPPFAILFCAFSWKSFFATVQVDSPSEASIGTNQPGSFREFLRNIFSKPVPVIVTFFLIATFSVTYFGLRIEPLGIEQSGLIHGVRKNEGDEKYSKSMEWALGNLPDGARIFNCNWDDFPKLFFLNQKQTYVYGLDPKYLHSRDGESYRLIKEITAGKSENPERIIYEKFEAKYIFTDAGENKKFVSQILRSGFARSVYKDDESEILEICDLKKCGLPD